MISYAKQKEAQRYRTHGYQRGKEGETNWEIRIGSIQTTGLEGKGIIPLPLPKDKQN